MGRGRRFFVNAMEQSAVGPELLPGQPIVEIAGQTRVLVENHRGVASYGNERILVKVSFGFLCVCGCGLQMMHMTRERLVISGRIDSVSLQRRG